MSLSLDQQKKNLRLVLLQKRLEEAERVHPYISGRRACEKFCQYLTLEKQPKPETALQIAGYWPIRDEIDPRPLMQYLRKRGHQIALPRIVAEHQPLTFHLWSDEKSLVTGPFGTRQPENTLPVLLPDMLLIPLVGFDGQGMRLGYGGGYYDRSLALLKKQDKFAKGRTPLCVGLAFDTQFCQHLPIQETDQPLDMVMTPNQVHDFIFSVDHFVKKAL